MIPTLPFGRTGHNSTRALFGGAALGDVTPEQSAQTLRLLLETGVNHIDTAISYGDAELHIGKWMPAHRDDFFLATKTETRTYAESKAQIESSLRRLDVDHVDLLQLHSLGEESEWEKVFADGGAFEAVLEARQQGKTRFLGVTGHGLDIARLHLKSLEIYPFEAVLLPLNYPLWRNESYRADFERLEAVCRERNVAMQIIKSVTRRPWGEIPQNYATWYQPLEEQDALDKAVAWVFGKGDYFLNTAGDVNVLPGVLEAVARFQGAPSDDEMAELCEAREMASLFV